MFGSRYILLHWVIPTQEQDLAVPFVELNDILVCSTTIHQSSQLFTIYKFPEGAPGPIIQVINEDVKQC